MEEEGVGDGRVMKGFSAKTQTLSGRVLQALWVHVLL